MPGAVFLENDEVELRTIEEEDLEFIRDNFNHPEVRSGLDYWKPQNLEQEREWFENVVCEGEGVHLAVCVDGEIKGIISLKDSAEKGIAEIGLWIGTDFHGQGLGTSASRLIVDYGFQQLNYHKIEARAIEKNKASRRLWQKLGFEEEARIREKIYRDGEFENTYWYGILKSEWKNE